MMYRTAELVVQTDNDTDEPVVRTDSYRLLGTGH